MYYTQAFQGPATGDQRNAALAGNSGKAFLLSSLLHKNPKALGRPPVPFFSFSLSLSVLHSRPSLSLSLCVRTSWNRTKGVYSISLHHPQSLLIMNFRTEKFLGVTAPISELESNEREKEVTVTLMEELRRQGTFESEAEAKTRSACNLYSRTPSLVRLCHQ